MYIFTIYCMTLVLRRRNAGMCKTRLAPTMTCRVLSYMKISGRLQCIISYFPKLFMEQ